jgi:hypothetical protein
MRFLNNTANMAHCDAGGGAVHSINSGRYRAILLKLSNAESAIKCKTTADRNSLNPTPTEMPAKIAPLRDVSGVHERQVAGPKPK